METDLCVRACVKRLSKDNINSRILLQNKQYIYIYACIYKLCDRGLFRELCVSRRDLDCRFDKYYISIFPLLIICVRHTTIQSVAPMFLNLISNKTVIKTKQKTKK